MQPKLLSDLRPSKPEAHLPVSKKLFPARSTGSLSPLVLDESPRFSSIFLRFFFENRVTGEKHCQFDFNEVSTIFFFPTTLFYSSFIVVHLVASAPFQQKLSEGAVGYEYTKTISLLDHSTRGSVLVDIDSSNDDQRVFIHTTGTTGLNNTVETTTGFPNVFNRRAGFERPSGSNNGP